MPKQKATPTDKDRLVGGYYKYFEEMTRLDQWQGLSSKLRQRNLEK